jgi:hypothetical protein
MNTRSFEEWCQASGEDIEGFTVTRGEICGILEFWIQHLLEMYFSQFVHREPVLSPAEEFAWQRVANIKAVVDEDTFSNALFLTILSYGPIQIPENLKVPWRFFAHSSGRLRDSGAGIMEQFEHDAQTRDEMLVELLGPGHRTDRDVIPWELQIRLNKLFDLSDMPHDCGCFGSQS